MDSPNKTWSDTRGAHQVLVHVSTGTNLEATDRLLKRSGAKCIWGWVCGLNLGAMMKLMIEN